MILDLKNEKIIKGRSQISQDIISKIEARRVDWYSKSTHIRMQQAEWELMYYGKSIEALDKRFALKFKDMDGELRDLSEYNEYKERNKKRQAYIYDENQLDDQLNCNLTTLEKEEGVPAVSMILNELASQYIDALSNKDRIVDIDYPTDNKVARALQKFMTTYGKSAKANIELAQVIRDFVIKGRGYMRAVLDTETTNIIDGLDTDLLILPPNHTDINYISGYYVVHTLSQDEIRHRFPAIWDIFLEPDPVDDTQNQTLFGTMDTEGRMQFTATLIELNNPVREKTTKPNKGGAPSFESKYRKYLENFDKKTTLLHSGTSWKLGRTLNNMYDSYDNNKFSQVVLGMKANEYLIKKDDLTSGESLDHNLLYGLGRGYGLKPDYLRNLIVSNGDCVEIFEYVDLEGGKRFFYTQNILLSAEDISDKLGGYKLCEIAWNSTSASSTNKGGGYGISSLIGDMARDFKELIFATEVKSKMEGYIAASKVVLNGSVFDDKALNQMRGSNLVIKTTPDANKDRAIESMQSSSTQLPPVFQVNYAPANLDYLLPKPANLKAEMKARVTKVEQLNYQITKEQASSELSSRDTPINLAIQDFFNQVSVSHPYNTLRYILDHYNSDVFIPQVAEMTTEAVGSKVGMKVDNELVKALDLKDIKITQNIPSTKMYRSSALIISKDKKAENMTKQAIQNAYNLISAAIVDNAKATVLNSEEFKSEAKSVIEQIKAERMQEKLAGTNMRPETPEEVQARTEGQLPPVKPPAPEVLGVPIEEDDTKFVQDDPSVMPQDSKVVEDPNYLKSVIVEIFKKYFNQELEKANFEPLVDTNIYVTEVEIELAIKNATFSFKPLKTKEEKMKEQQSLLVLAQNLGVPLKSEEFFLDILSMMGYSEDLVRTEPQQRAYLANKVFANFSVNMTPTPEQIPQIMERVADIKIEPPKPTAAQLPPELQAQMEQQQQQMTPQA